MTQIAARGIGVDGAVGPKSVAELAALAESCGYGSFWLNVLGPRMDPIESLRLAVARTRTVEIGVGVFPLDQYPTADLGRRLAAIEMSMPRVIIGVAAGQIRHGAMAITEDAVHSLRAALPQCRISTGGYGPKMLELGGRLADVVLGNWLTTERLDWLIAQVKRGAELTGRVPPPVYLYHRAATGDDAILRLRKELSEYRRYPVHQSHQAAMGNPEWIGVATSDPAEIGRQLAPYAQRCHVVLKPLPRDAGDLDEWRSLIRFFAPTS
ncbi:MAG: hypothetical protein ACHQAQ_02320 [Hyphomicrobiales bacterium]